MIELRWAERARRDLFEIEAYYEDIVSGPGEAMTERIEAAPLVLLDHPSLGPPISDTPLRKWVVRGTRVILLYRATRDRVEIARVLNGPRDWPRWLA